MPLKHLSIFPWSMHSEPAEKLRNVLSNKLDYKVFKVFANKGFEPRPGQAILDWGRSDIPKWDRPDLNWLNHPDKVRNAVDKLRSFARFEHYGVNCVPFTRHYQKAAFWLETDKWVVCRQDTSGYDGKGLFLAKTPNQLVPAPLYTQFIQSTREFRAYIFRGEGIDLLEKKDGSNPYIRTDGNDWSYQRTSHWPAEWEVEARKAVKACGLDFGGVDMLWDGHKWWVLEVNTAPDIAYLTVEKFANGVVKWLQGL